MLVLGLETQVLDLGFGLGRRLEKILTHYIDTINSLLFDSDTKLADICSQMEFVSLDTCSREYLLFLPAQGLF